MLAESVVYCEPADEIINSAAAAGVEISKGQLGDWHRAGLLQLPEVQYPGDGGSRSVYPSGTAKQAIECARLMDRLHSIDDVGWALWLRGFTVREDVWLKQIAAAHQAFVKAHNVGVEDDAFSDRMEEAIRRIAAKKRLMKPLGQARRRLRQSEMEQALALVLSTIVGPRAAADDPEVRRDESLVGRLVGLEPANKKRKIPPAPLLNDSASDFSGRLNEMAEVLPDLKNPTFLESYSAADLCATRDELSFLLNAYRWVRRAEAKIIGRASADARFLEELLGNSDTALQAQLILFWLACRQIPWWKSGMKDLIKKIKAPKK